VRRCRQILQRRVVTHGICIPAQGSVTDIPELSSGLNSSNGRLLTVRAVELVGDGHRPLSERRTQEVVERALVSMV